MGGRSPSPSAIGVYSLPMGPPIWSSRSQTTARARRSVERGDPKKVGPKVCAQRAGSIPLISEGLRFRSIGRRPKVSARPARRGPYSVAHRSDRATPADSRPRSVGSNHDPFQDGGPSMTPRHTTPAPVAHGGVRAVAHGRGRGRTAAEQTAGAPRQERRTAAAEDGYRARGRTPRPAEKGWST